MFFFIFLFLHLFFLLIYIFSFSSIYLSLFPSIYLFASPHFIQGFHPSELLIFISSFFCILSSLVCLSPSFYSLLSILFHFTCLHLLCFYVFISFFLLEIVFLSTSSSLRIFPIFFKFASFVSLRSHFSFDSSLPICDIYSSLIFFRHFSIPSSSTPTLLSFFYLYSLCPLSLSPFLSLLLSSSSSSSSSLILRLLLSLSLTSVTNISFSYDKPYASCLSLFFHSFIHSIIQFVFIHIVFLSHCVFFSNLSFYCFFSFIAVSPLDSNFFLSLHITDFQSICTLSFTIILFKYPRFIHPFLHPFISVTSMFFPISCLFLSFSFFLYHSIYFPLRFFSASLLFVHRLLSIQFSLLPSLPHNCISFDLLIFYYFHSI
ncbi:unnamed protein product [Acanthosepion pharaonis]|uniref:Uncharacterized protein n=1 Tax=Acanthosepion pharaonis TaxID=158019 RepID=A0A812E453_ACAPH|nr:unnamed protein product [Sepia pharaonis]